MNSATTWADPDEEDALADIAPPPVPKPKPSTTVAAKVCRNCKEPQQVLHHDPDRPTDPSRVLCGKCQGDINRQILDSLAPRKKDH